MTHHPIKFVQQPHRFLVLAQQQLRRSFIFWPGDRGALRLNTDNVPDNAPRGLMMKPSSLHTCAPLCSQRVTLLEYFLYIDFAIDLET